MTELLLQDIKEKNAKYGEKRSYPNTNDTFAYCICLCKIILQWYAWMLYHLSLLINFSEVVCVRVY